MSFLGHNSRIRERSKAEMAEGGFPSRTNSRRVYGAENESATERLEMIDLRAKQSEKQGTMESVFQESAQVRMNLCTLRFPATVGK
jgi:hypothetical protein